MTVWESAELAPSRETRSYFALSRVVMVKVSSRSWVSVVVAIFENNGTRRRAFVRGRGGNVIAGCAVRKFVRIRRG